jgi:hypothetical protein
VKPARPARPVAGAPTAGPASAAQKWAAQPLLEQLWSLDALRSRLPLGWPVDPDQPPSPKSRYRLVYRSPDPATLPDPTQWATLSDFELALALIDLGPLERELATQYVPSANGQVPFHPVSLFLAVCLRLGFAE